MTEVLSEHVSKKRRGRPRVVPVESLAIYRAYFPEVKTARGKNNIFHQQRALYAIRSWGDDDERLRWLCDSEAEVMAGTGRVRRSILQDLGRIEDFGDMYEAALWLCEHKPTAREARVLLRQWRGANRKQPGALELANTIIAKINDYMKRFPAITDQDVRNALATVAGQVEAGADG